MQIINIRKATINDIGEIQKIAKETWHQTYKGLIPFEIQDRFIESAYSDKNVLKRINNSLFLVALINEKVVGFANFYWENSKAILGALYIYPTEQRKGIGSKLLYSGIAEFDNVPKLFVEVEKGNKVGECFYKSKGFRRIEEYDDELYGYNLKTTRMVLEN